MARNEHIVDDFFVSKNGGKGGTFNILWGEQSSIEHQNGSEVLVTAARVEISFFLGREKGTMSVSTFEKSVGRYSCLNSR